MNLFPPTARENVYAIWIPDGIGRWSLQD
jgi:hypothetical protein